MDGDSLASRLLVARSMSSPGSWIAKSLSETRTFSEVLEDLIKIRIRCQRDLVRIGWREDESSGVPPSSERVRIICFLGVPLLPCGGGENVQRPRLARPMGGGGADAGRRAGQEPRSLRTGAGATQESMNA